MENFEEINKKISFAEFLMGRGSSNEYTLGALKHITIAASLLIREITGINEFDCQSPQLVESTLKKFKEKEISEFGKFYTKLMLKEGKASISVSEVQEDIHKLKKYIEWARIHKGEDKKENNFFTGI